MIGGRVRSSLAASFYFAYPFAAMAVALILSIRHFSAESISVGPLLSILLATAYRGIAVSTVVAVLAVTVAAAGVLHFKVGADATKGRIGVRVFILSTQFFSPLLVALGWIVALGRSRIAFSLTAMTLGLLSLAIPPAYIVLDLYVGRRVTRYIETASALGAGGVMRFKLALALARPALVGGLLITFAWTYCDLVIISLLGSGNQFYPGPLVSYLVRQSTVPELALFATLPSVAIALGAATMAQRSRKGR